MIDEKKMYTEVYMTLSKISNEKLTKIPQELKNLIMNKADTSYPYQINELMPESKAYIAAILKKYFDKDLEELFSIKY